MSRATILTLMSTVGNWTHQAAKIIKNSSRRISAWILHIPATLQVSFKITLKVVLVAGPQGSGYWFKRSWFFFRLGIPLLQTPTPEPYPMTLIQLTLFSPYDDIMRPQVYWKQFFEIKIQVGMLLRLKFALIVCAHVKTFRQLLRECFCVPMCPDVCMCVCVCVCVCVYVWEKEREWERALN